MLMVAGRLSVIASRLSGLCLSNHGLAPVANGFHAFGTVWPGCDNAGLALRKSFTALAGSLSRLMIAPLNELLYLQTKSSSKKLAE